MTGIRMNLSHGPLSAHKDWLDIIHAVGIPQLLIDLQGPELRIGTLTRPLVLETGQSLRLGQGGVPCPAALVQAARPGQDLLLDDGRLLCAGGRSRRRCPAVYRGAGRHPAKPQKALQRRGWR